jgi:hypothetical protein
MQDARWYASIQTVREVEQPVPSAAGPVGIDMGIARFATLSDGSFVAPLNSFKKHEAQLRRSQRALSRKTQFSQNWRKAKGSVQRIHKRRCGGSMNVLARGHRVEARGEEGSGSGRRTRTKPASVKQEPTEVTTSEHAHA